MNPLTGWQGRVAQALNLCKDPSSGLSFDNGARSESPSWSDWELGTKGNVHWWMLEETGK